MEKILVIEDDRATRKALQTLFETEGYPITLQADGLAGLESFRTEKPDIVILDLKMPKMRDQDVCREIRKLSPAVPIIALTGEADEMNRVLLLELGADDFVSKPFSPKELIARVRAILRRANRPRLSETYQFGRVHVNFSRMELTCAGDQKALTPQEFKLLKYFIEHAERVLSREELLNEVWGYKSYPTTRTVDAHVLNLRQKLEQEPSAPVHFLTVHNVGYKFVPGTI